jgi:predicted enzyme related to lactoylglutathione lyase
MSVKITSIGQIALTVQDMPRAVAFYRDILGLRYLFEATGMAFFDCNGVRLMLSVADKPDSTYGSIIYYQTDEIETAAAGMQARGVKFEAPPRMIAKMPDHDLWMAFLRDTEGNLLALMSEVRHETAAAAK